MHGRISHVQRLLVALHGLLHISQAWYSKIKESTYVYFYLCGFNRYDSHGLVLYKDRINIEGCLEQLMMWCSLLLAHDIDLRDVGV